MAEILSNNTTSNTTIIDSDLALFLGIVVGCSLSLFYLLYIILKDLIVSCFSLILSACITWIQSFIVNMLVGRIMKY